LECLPSHVVDQIAKIPFSHFGDSSDKLIWQSSSNGDFSVRSAYNIAASCESDTPVLWKGIWTLNVPPKLKLFAWTVAHGRLLTNASRYSRHLCIDPYCSFYPGYAESMLHLLRDCSLARRVWDAIKVPGMISNFF
jgi:hypothetical protein